MATSAAPSPLVRELIEAIGEEAVVWQPEDLLVYEYDATIDRGRPEAIALPAATEDVAALIRICNRRGAPITPRGAGTGLSGGALATKGGVVFGMNRMRRILEIDAENKTARVQPGVVNLDLGAAAEPYGLAYAPDPSSQRACTIGGNVAENAGGPHTLAWGTTTNHVLELVLVTPDGEVQRNRQRHARSQPGYDPGRLRRGQRRHGRDRHRGARAACAQAQRRPHPVGDLRFCPRSEQCGQRGRRLRRRPGCAGDDR